MFNLFRYIAQIWDPCADRADFLEPTPKSCYSNEVHWKAIEESRATVEGLSTTEYRKQMEKFWIENAASSATQTQSGQQPSSPSSQQEQFGQPLSKSKIALAEASQPIPANHAAEEVKAAKIAADKLMVKTKIRAVHNVVALHSPESSKSSRKLA